MTPPPPRPAPWRFPVWEAASLFLSATAVLALFAQIRTYVTGQDPTLYIKLARLVLEHPPGSELFKQGMTQVAPGFTLLLASFMGTFGTTAAYWVAPVCFLLLLPVWLALARGISGDRLRGALAVPGIVFLLLGIPYLAAPYFLLYPFRSTPTYLLIALAHVLVMRGDRAGSRTAAWLAAAGMCLLLAVGVREVKLALLPTFLLWAGLRQGRAGTGRRVGWLLSPFLVMVPLALLVAALSKTGLSNQAAYVVDMLARTTPGDQWAEWRANMVTQFMYLRNSAGLPGLVCLLAGLWAHRRSWDAWGVVVLPALVMFTVYGLFLAHPRYTLTTLVLLAPLAALGAVDLALRVAGGLGRWCGPHARTAVAVLVLMVPAALVAANWLHLKPLGPRVGQREVERASRDLDSFLRPGDFLLTEGTCAYLVDFLQVFTRHPFTAAVLSPLPPVRGRLMYFRPINDDAVYLRDRLPYRLFANQLPYLGYDLLPLRDPAGQTRVFALGRSRYQVEEARPWSENQLVLPKVDVSTRGAVLWFDFQQRTDCAPARVRVSGPGGEERVAVETPGTGLVAVYAPPGDRRVEVRVESDDPLPRDALDAVLRPGLEFTRDLGYIHHVSPAAAFEPPPNAWTAGVGAARALPLVRLPALRGFPPGFRLVVRVHFQLPLPLSLTGRWTVDRAGVVVDTAATAGTASGRCALEAEVFIDALSGGEALRFDVPGLLRHPSRPRVRAISYEILPPVAEGG